MPYCPPEPKEPANSVLKSTLERDISSLLNKEYEADVKLFARDREFSAHRIILASASRYFYQLFTSLSKEEKGAKIKSIDVKVFQNFSENSVQQFLRFAYTGFLDLAKIEDMDEFRKIIEISCVNELQMIVECAEEGCPRYDIRNHLFVKLLTNLKNVCFKRQLFSDVIFEVDDGICYAHKPLLMARCAFMEVMFRGDFRESSANVVPFPGVSKLTFYYCLYYLYTDRVADDINAYNCLPVIELADRLCLPHFITLIEVQVIEHFKFMMANRINFSQLVCKLLQPCQFHNADQLSAWCQYYISIKYNDITMNYPNLLPSLHRENQSYLNENRWPPAHYIKEMDYYEQSVRQRDDKKKTSRFGRWKTASERKLKKKKSE